MTGRSMPDEGFLKRWSRRKTESRQGREPEAEPLPDAAPEDVAAPAPPAVAPAGVDAAAVSTEAPRLPTLDDVATLTPDSDYSAFVARGVDQLVRRSALKKLFADPHFNTMDRLDIYIDDYNKPSPVSEAMLASLRHAARLFAPAADESADQPAADAAPLVADETIAHDAADAPADTPPASAPRQHPEYPQHSPETETR
jgi:hypothetical protein